MPETNEKPYLVSPTLVARVKFSEWTQEHALRHPVFIALREDVREPVVNDLAAGRANDVANEWDFQGRTFPKETAAFGS